MTISSYAKSAIKLLTPPIFFKVANKLRKEPNLSWSELNHVLNAQQKSGIKINTVIDIGASNGMWSKEVMPTYPQANYFLIEANSYHENNLKNFAKRHSNVDYIIAAAGDTVGEIYFDTSSPFGGIASHEKRENFVAVPVITIDSLVKDKNLQGPFIVKLDTHGFEVPILEGATETLKEAEFVILEVYNFHIAKGSLLFHEMCEYMLKKGFRTIGLVDRLYRPKDNVLWQFDLVFAKETRTEFQDNDY